MFGVCSYVLLIVLCILCAVCTYYMYMYTYVLLLRHYEDSSVCILQYVVQFVRPPASGRLVATVDVL